MRAAIQFSWLPRLTGALLLVALGTACAENAMPVVATSPTEVSPPVPAPLPVPIPVAERARYRVTFNSVWSAATHPQDFPPDAHFSGLIGGTHDETVAFWQPGMLATEGIRAMAERGVKAGLSDEITAAVAAGSAASVISGGAIGRSPGAVVHDFEITTRHHRVTLVTMVAPSPDWFVGVNGMSLLGPEGWVNETRVELFAYDAGTDSGTTFTSPDVESRPRLPVFRIDGFPFQRQGRVEPLGTFIFARIDEN